MRETVGVASELTEEGTKPSQNIQTSSNLSNKNAIFCSCHLTNSDTLYVTVAKELLMHVSFILNKMNGTVRNRCFL